MAESGMDELMRWINTTQAAQEAADLDRPHIIMVQCAETGYLHAVGPFTNAFLALEHVEYLKSEWADEEIPPTYHTLLLLPGLRVGETEDAI